MWDSSDDQLTANSPVLTTSDLLITSHLDIREQQSTVIQIPKQHEEHGLQ